MAKAPAKIRSYARATIKPMRLWLGANSDPTFRIRDAEKLYSRVMRRVMKIADDTGMDSGGVWDQIEREARKAGSLHPSPGRDY